MRTLVLALLLSLCVVERPYAQEIPTIGHVESYGGIICESEETARFIGDAYREGGTLRAEKVARQLVQIGLCYDLKYYRLDARAVAIVDTYLYHDNAAVLVQAEILDTGESSPFYIFGPFLATVV